MKNILLLSGMDGTGILFCPLLDKLNDQYRIAIYDFNDDINQQLNHQAKKIIKFIHHNFGNHEFILIAESYSSLLLDELLKHELNIQKVYIIGGFLSCPSLLAKIGHLLNPVWLRLLPKQLLGHLLFYRWSNDELMALFGKVLAKISKSDVLPLFRQRLKNIAHAKAPKHLTKSSTPCVYVSASHDYLVNPKSGLAFKELFYNIKFIKANGTHFLLQTNPCFLADELNDCG